MDLSKGKQIEIADKQLFDDYFLKFTPEISELTFTNLFMWRKYYNYLFLEWKEHLLIFSRTKTENAVFFLLPVGSNPVKIILDIFINFKNAEFHRIPASVAEEINQLTNSTIDLEIVEDPANYDYVYAREKLVKLPGTKLYQKRKWIRKFNDRFPHDFKLISEDLIEECRKLQIEWCELRECKAVPSLQEEQAAINEAFDNYSDLRFRGGILYVEGKAVAYTLGELLNSDTVVIHVEKAHTDYPGSYQVINNLFAKNCCEGAEFINREQDLGDPGLRKAKSLYQPDKMVKKFIIYRKNS